MRSSEAGFAKFFHLQLACVGLRMPHPEILVAPHFVQATESVRIKAHDKQPATIDCCPR